jgi:hypothetical protein
MRLREFEEIEILKAKLCVEVTVKSKVENSYDFCLDFVLRKRFLPYRTGRYTFNVYEIGLPVET